MPEGHDTTIEVSNIMSFVLYTQILKQSVLKPASPGITLSEKLQNENLCLQQDSHLALHDSISSALDHSATFVRYQEEFYNLTIS